MFGGSGDAVVIGASTAFRLVCAGRSGMSFAWITARFFTGNLAPGAEATAFDRAN